MRIFCPTNLLHIKLYSLFGLYEILFLFALKSVIAIMCGLYTQRTAKQYLLLFIKLLCSLFLFSSILFVCVLYFLFYFNWKSFYSIWYTIYCDHQQILSLGRFFHRWCFSLRSNLFFLTLNFSTELFSNTFFHLKFMNIMFYFAIFYPAVSFSLHNNWYMYMSSENRIYTVCSIKSASTSEHRCMCAIIHHTDGDATNASYGLSAWHKH